MHNDLRAVGFLVLLVMALLAAAANGLFWLTDRFYFTALLAWGIVVIAFAGVVGYGAGVAVGAGFDQGHKLGPRLGERVRTAQAGGREALTSAPAEREEG